MKIIINPKGTLAIYEQIVNHIRNSILTGELSPGELEKENLIHSVAGKGFYVCENNREYLKEKNYRLLEKRMEELLRDCTSAGMSKKEILTMVEELIF